MPRSAAPRTVGAASQRPAPTRAQGAMSATALATVTQCVATGPVPPGLRGPHRGEELVDLELEVVAFAGQCLRRGEHLRGGRARLGGAAIDLGDVAGDLGGPARRLLHVARNLLGGGALLLDGGGDR